MKMWTLYLPPTINTTCDFAWRCELRIHHPLLTLSVTSHEGVNLYSPPTINTICDFTWWCEFCHHHQLSILSVTLHDGVNFAITTHYQHYLWLHMKVWTLQSPPTINTICDFAWRCEPCIHHSLSTLPVTVHECASFESTIHCLNTLHEGVSCESTTHYQNYL